MGIASLFLIFFPPYRLSHSPPRPLAFLLSFEARLPVAATSGWRANNASSPLRGAKLPRCHGDRPLGYTPSTTWPPTHPPLLAHPLHFPSSPTQVSRICQGLLSQRRERRREYPRSGQKPPWGHGVYQVQEPSNGHECHSLSSRCVGDPSTCVRL